MTLEETKKDYTGYTNPELKDPNRIFTREEVKSMNSNEYSKNEKGIFYQMKAIGLPSKQELSNSDGIVHVNAYDRSTGHVREHYRSKPHKSNKKPKNGDYRYGKDQRGKYREDYWNGKWNRRYEWEVESGPIATLPDDKL